MDKVIVLLAYYFGSLCTLNILSLKGQVA